VNPGDIGETGGADSINISHSHTMNHSHTATCGASNSNGFNFWIQNGGAGQPALNNHTHSISVQSITANTGTALNANQSIVPRYVGVLKLVRIR
jgi:hypothetical protein